MSEETEKILDESIEVDQQDTPLEVKIVKETEKNVNTEIENENLDITKEEIEADG